MINRCNYSHFLAALALSTLSLALAACGDLHPKASYPAPQDAADAQKHGTIGQALNGDDSGGITLFDTARKRQAGQGQGLGVNAYLWRAALDTISFMPILSADSTGGTLLTDWYSPPATPNERLKLNIVIKDQTLRADGVTVTVFKQQLVDGAYKDEAVNPAVGTQLEDTIVQRARQLRLANEGR